jgi:hypothetical protein
MRVNREGTKARRAHGGQKPLRVFVPTWLKRNWVCFAFPDFDQDKLRHFTTFPDIPRHARADGSALELIALGVV